MESAFAKVSLPSAADYGVSATLLSAVSKFNAERFGDAAGRKEILGYSICISRFGLVSLFILAQTSLTNIFNYT